MRVASHTFLWCEPATHEWSHAKRIEVVWRHQTADRAFGAIANTQSRRDQLIEDERFYQRALLLEINAIGIGKLIWSGGAARRSDKGKHSFLVDDGRIRMKQNSFSPAQNGGVGADSECQTKNGQDREGGVAPESAEAEAHILSELVRPEPHTLFPRDLLPVFDTAKFPKRRVARFTGQHAGRDFPLRCFIKVLLDFLGYLRIALLLSKRAEKTPARCADYFHCQVAVKTRLIPLVMRDQCSLSAASCLRPAAVSS